MSSILYIYSYVQQLHGHTKSKSKQTTFIFIYFWVLVVVPVVTVFYTGGKYFSISGIANNTSVTPRCCKHTRRSITISLIGDLVVITA